jgi:predicted nucleotidyltransferase
LRKRSWGDVDALKDKAAIKSVKAKVRDVASAIFSDTPVQFAYLYGSFAKETNHPFSDLDVAIYIDGLNLKSSLDLELTLSLSMDQSLEHIVPSEVRIINYLPLTLQGDIITSGILIFSQNEEKRIEFETRVRMTYFDFLPVIRNYELVYFGDK